jgi:hypothetical protein
MNQRKWAVLGMIALAAVLVPALLEAASQEPGPQEPKQGFDKKGPPFAMKDKGPGGFGFVVVAGPGGQKLPLVKKFDKNGDGWLNAEERKEARAFLKTQGGGPGRFGPGGKGKGFMVKGKGPPGFGPGGFVVVGPGNFLTKPLLEALDTDRDGKLSKDELLAGVRTFFTDSDKEKKGTLSQDELAANLNRIFPTPPGFPGGGGPKGPPFGPPRDFGPGNLLAVTIFERADANKDGKVTLKELVAAAEALFKEVDKNKDGKLDEQEVAAGINLLFPAPKFGPGGFGPPGFGKGNRDPAKPGPRVAPADVTNYPKASLYEPTVLRTLFLEFENADWEAELADFRNTDVEVPCTLTVDGKKYTNVGVHFRGMSSYFGVAPGYKRSLNLSLDLVDKKQKLYGYKTLNLLNSHDDPTFLHSVLFAQVAREYIPAPKANFVKVVINGESWGIYSNAQQFNKDFLADNYKTRQGARWKVKGPGDGGLAYIGDNVEEYRRRYTLKSKDNPRDWKALIDLCRTLSQTPLDRLEEALKPILDIDGVLWFLALDNATINEDGYWVRGSDYNLYRDPQGKFHVIPHDTNETFGPMMGFGPGFGKGPPGGGFGKGPKGEGGFGKGPKEGGGFGMRLKGGPGGGPGAPSYALDPLIGLDNPRRPLRSRLLAVPSLRARYLEHVRTIAEKSFDWDKLRPVVAQYRALIEKEVEIDTRKLYTLAEFKSSLTDVAPTPGQGSRFNLRAFFEGRRNYLLNYPAIKELRRGQGGSTKKTEGD